MSTKKAKSGNTDISKLSAAELDQLIANAAKLRSEKGSAFPDQPPQAPAGVLVNPRWQVGAGPDGTLLQIQHPGYGWLSFVIPAPERAYLASLLLCHSLTQVTAVTITPTTPATTGGGGTLH